MRRCRGVLGRSRQPGAGTGLHRRGRAQGRGPFPAAGLCRLPCGGRRAGHRPGPRGTHPAGPRGPEVAPGGVARLLARSGGRLPARAHARPAALAGRRAATRRMALGRHRRGAATLARRRSRGQAAGPTPSLCHVPCPRGATRRPAVASLAHPEARARLPRDEAAHGEGAGSALHCRTARGRGCVPRPRRDRAVPPRAARLRAATPAQRTMHCLPRPRFRAVDLGDLGRAGKRPGATAEGPGPDRARRAGVDLGRQQAAAVVDRALPHRRGEVAATVVGRAHAGVRGARCSDRRRPRARARLRRPGRTAWRRRRADGDARRTAAGDRHRLRLRAVPRARRQAGRAGVRTRRHRTADRARPLAARVLHAVARQPAAARPRLAHAEVRRRQGQDRVHRSARWRCGPEHRAWRRHLAQDHQSAGSQAPEGHRQRA